ncbi:cysteine-rich secretory protein 3-like [Hyla sarda]|uniref:cysteine-rich secretory protein 3-like n=1 Tax=Hyla sarda TaxID=327740 RepID=UPI0024C37529|nr:cysteine-rich secretory protein 3-like [Hyla sarda]XP_056419010.1 cysteine-rich secretory protein 3-like [Hyla sarda]
MWTFILSLSSLVVYVVAQTAEQLAAVDTTKAAVQQQILDLVNECRRTVQPTATNMLKVQWNAEASKTAEAWAKQCQFVHSKQADKQITNYICGENLYSTSYATNWKEAIEKFCNEKVNFTYGQGKVSGTVVEHYTQQVWYNSYLIGCYAAYCPNGKTYKWFFVCHQCPEGNLNQIIRPYTSGTTCGACPNNCDNKLCTNSCNIGNTFTNCNTYKGRCDVQAVKDGCKGMCQCPNAII